MEISAHTPAPDLHILGLPETGCISVQLQGDIRSTAVVPVAPLFALIADILNIEIAGSYLLDPASFSDAAGERWIFTEDEAGHLAVRIFVDLPEASFSPQGRLRVHPENSSAKVGFWTTYVNSGGSVRKYGELTVDDLLRLLTDDFQLTVTDEARVLTRHLRERLPAFEVFDDGTTRMLPEGWDSQL